MTVLAKITFKDTRRFGLKFWPTKKFTRKQKEVYLKKNRKKLYKQSFFCRKLFQRKKIALFYGNLSYQPFQIKLDQLNKFKGDRLKNFFLTMEKRLDVLCFRMKFFSTLGTARQMILHNKVFLNGQPAKFSQINVKIGDIISIDPFIFPQITKSIRTYLKVITLLVRKKGSVSNILPVKKISAQLPIYNKTKEYSMFNHLFFEKKSLNNTLEAEKNYYYSSKLEKIIIKKQYWLQKRKTKQNINEKKNNFANKNKINFNAEKFDDSLRTIATNLKFSKLNSYKLPHLEVNYATLTAILLPYQPNLGFYPTFPESLSYTIIKKKE